jgi:hypothetical protein
LSIKGMIADLNVHWDIGEDGQAQTPRPCHAHHARGEETASAQKVRDWNKAELVEQWRERWAEHVNERLAELDIDARIDHRSLEAQGIALEPQTRSAPAAAHRRRGLEAERIERNTALSHSAMASGSSPIHPPSRWTRSRTAIDLHAPRPCDVRASAQRRKGAVRFGDERDARIARSYRAWARTDAAKTASHRAR